MNRLFYILLSLFLLLLNFVFYGVLEKIAPLERMGEKAIFVVVSRTCFLLLCNMVSMRSFGSVCTQVIVCF